MDSYSLFHCHLTRVGVVGCLCVGDSKFCCNFEFHNGIQLCFRTFSIASAISFEYFSTFSDLFPFSSRLMMMNGKCNVSALHVNVQLELLAIFAFRLYQQDESRRGMNVAVFLPFAHSFLSHKDQKS